MMYKINEMNKDKNLTLLLSLLLRITLIIEISTILIIFILNPPYN